MASTTVDLEERPVLAEMLTWVKALKDAGVSADKAAEVSKDLLIAAMMQGGGEFEEYDEWDEDDDEEDEEE